MRVLRFKIKDRGWMLSFRIPSGHSSFIFVSDNLGNLYALTQGFMTEWRRFIQTLERVSFSSALGESVVEVSKESLDTAK
jgi:hypothetical protein